MMFLLLASVLLMAQGVPAPVPRDIPGPAPAPGVTPPERLERPRMPADGVTVLPAIPRDGVIVPPVTPPMPQADVPDETPGTTRVIPPQNDGIRSPPGLQLR
ncbi:MAG: hypothetical protein K5Q68_17245 [Roseococcus sp.]|nr:hypothetical protein [Roseococcus sp.]